MNTKFPKVIKKALKGLGWLIGSVLILLLISYWLIRLPGVQTWAAQKAAERLSKDLETTIRIDRVEIEFIKTVVLKGVYVEDLEHDTLLFASSIEVVIDELDLDSNRLVLAEVALEDVEARIRKYKGDSVLNFQFMIDHFAAEPDTTSSKQWFIACSGLKLSNTHFIYQDQNVDSVKTGMNYSDIDLMLALDLQEIQMDADTISAHLAHLQAKDHSGVDVRRMHANVTASPAGISLRRLGLNMNETHLEGDISFSHDDYSAYSDFLNSVILRASIDLADLHAKDLAYFVPQLEGLDRKVKMTGKFRGPIASFKGRDVHLELDRHTWFRGDFDLDGLPNIEETFISLEIDELATNKRDLDRIPLPPFDGGKTMQTPTMMAKLGDIRINGEFTGFIYDFAAYATIGTAVGTIRTDIHLAEDLPLNTYEYSGTVAADQLQLGRLMDQQDMLGAVTFDAEISGQGLDKNATLILDAIIPQAHFNGYDYNNTAVAGMITNQQFAGKVDINDPSVQLDFDGAIDLSHSEPIMAFSVELDSTNLYALNFLKRDSITRLDADFHINLIGYDINTMDGDAQIKNLRYSEGDNTMHLESIGLLASGTEKDRELHFSSDIATVNISGDFNTVDLPNNVQYILSRILPAYFPDSIAPPDRQQQFSYDARVHDVAGAAAIFLPDLKLSNEVLIKGGLNTSNRSFAFSMNAEDVSYGKNRFRGVELELLSENDMANLRNRMKRVELTDSLWLDDVNLQAKANNNQVDFGLNWDNTDSVDYSANVKGSSVILSPKHYEIKLEPSKVTFTDSTWTFTAAKPIEIDSTSITVNDLIITKRNEEMKVFGTMSERHTDKLSVEMKNIDLANINIFTKSAGLELAGIVDGTSRISNPYKDMLFMTGLNIDGLAMNGRALGDGKLTANYNSKRESITLAGGFHNDLVNTFSLKGGYYPKRKKNSLDIDVKFQELPLETFQPFVKDHLDTLQGIASGGMSITGTPVEPLMKGKLKLRDTKLFVNYTRCGYSFNKADFIIEDDWLGFDQIDIVDDNGNVAKANGTILHNNFSDINFDVSVDMERFKCLNTTVEDNPLYYGSAYMSGLTSVGGYADNLIIEATVKTERGTRFFIPLSGSADVQEYDYITFINKDTSSAKKEDEYKADLAGIEMNLELEVTPDAEMELIFDEKIGDKITGRGEGNLRMEVSTLGDFNMYGDFIIDKGDYLFTLQNVINKKFKVKKGGSIGWTGSPYEADVNLDAVYSLKAPPGDITRDTTREGKKRTPVDVHLLMVGSMMSPSLTFDIDLPTASEQVRSAVKSAIPNDQEMNKQAFALLMLNRFMPPPDVSGTNEARTGVGGTTGSELLSNQLSNWLSQISDDFDIGVNYRPGDEISSDEVEVALSTQLLNDRLTLETNVGVSDDNRGGDENASAVTGDFRMEYRLTDDGKLRAIAYNKSTDQSIVSANNSKYTQGAGVSYKEEFDTLGELFRRRKKEKEERRRKRKARKEQKGE